LVTDQQLIQWEQALRDVPVACALIVRQLIAEVRQLSKQIRIQDYTIAISEPIIVNGAPVNFDDVMHLHEVITVLRGENKVLKAKLDGTYCHE